MCRELHSFCCKILMEIQRKSFAFISEKLDLHRELISKSTDCSINWVRLNCVEFSLGRNEKY